VTNHNPSRPEVQANTLVPLLVLRQDSFRNACLVSARVGLLLVRQAPTGGAIQVKNLKCRIGMTIIAQTLDGVVVRVRRLTHLRAVVVEPISPIPVRVYIVLMVVGLTVADKVHQEVMPEWNMRSFGTPVVELANPEDNDFPVSDSSLEAGYEMFSDLDSPGRVHCFLEGRRLLFGV